MGRESFGRTARLSPPLSPKWRAPHFLQGEQGGLPQELGHPQEGRLPPLPAGRQLNPAWPPAHRRGGPPSMAVFPQGRDSETRARASAPVLDIPTEQGGWSTPTPPRLPQPSRLRPEDRTAGSAAESRPAICSVTWRSKKRGNRRP